MERDKKGEIMTSYVFRFRNKKRKCLECGKNYTANSAGQKYCTQCAPKVQRRKQKIRFDLYKKIKERETKEGKK